ncbi:hypothetical protein K449DRAFT_429815 [Hypoxylon sp. EC38]|nr:hypothetical protein K449DRAFT_429815 [Hypoxylon sp. EC38]
MPHRWLPLRQRLGRLEARIEFIARIVGLRPHDIAADVEVLAGTTAHQLNGSSRSDKLDAQKERGRTWAPPTAHVEKQAILSTIVKKRHGIPSGTISAMAEFGPNVFFDAHWGPHRRSLA